MLLSRGKMQHFSPEMTMCLKENFEGFRKLVANLDSVGLHLQNCQNLGNAAERYIVCTELHNT